MSYHLRSFKVILLCCRVTVYIYSIKEIRMIAPLFECKECNDFIGYITDDTLRLSITSMSKKYK